eukprot:scaffold4504_cov116-Isochrysis_galbana.AAC.3
MLSRASPLPVHNATGRDGARLDRKVGVCRAVHAQHVEREGVLLVEDAHGVKGGGDGHVGLGRKGAQLLPATDRTLRGTGLGGSNLGECARL